MKNEQRKSIRVFSLYVFKKVYKAFYLLFSGTRFLKRWGKKRETYHTLEKQLWRNRGKLFLKGQKKQKIGVRELRNKPI